MLMTTEASKMVYVWGCRDDKLANLDIEKKDVFTDSEKAL